MNHPLNECLSNQCNSYILPFLWLHGEPQERVKEEILAIKNSGISEFCAESRPYKNFCREQWWEDFGFILKTAKELDMRVWLLDDRAFPTGYANGYLEDPTRAHLRKKLIREKEIDVVGPLKHARIHVAGCVDSPDEELISAIAYRHASETEELDLQTAVDLTPTIRDGMAHWNIPEGVWRVCVLVKTPPKPFTKPILPFYIDMLNPDSCRAMIDAIYEPHYEHFKEYFGNTFAGFFSDEPGFLNHRGSYLNTLGLRHMPYPWNTELPARIAAHSGKWTPEEVALRMPALWEDLGDDTACLRVHYMEVITELYRENFSNLLGNWCREHGVLYIGHVIEDSGAHMRMGYGSGHFFRALDGQDMAGIDIVLIQDVPGMTDHIHRAPLSDEGFADPAFFRYTLPKLAASHSHIQPLKKGRAMCELFGAFGWAEGLPYMKNLADVMIASGINRFVPHAFSCKEEDPDCPPHFYNGGKNIQYPLFKNLMEYMTRCTHLLEGGTHVADVAVFYNAEGEWTGGKNQTIHALCKRLTNSQIDFDIIPYDYLKDADVVEQRLSINGETYGALLISQSEILPKKQLDCFLRLAKAGLPILFMETLPTRVAEGGDIAAYNASFEAVPTESLTECLTKMGLVHVRAVGAHAKNLRFYHVRRESEDVYLFSNEAIHNTADVILTLPQSGDCIVYEPWENQCYRATVQNGQLPLKLEKANVLFVLFGVEIPESLPRLCYEADRKELPLRFDVSVKDEDESDFRTIATNAEPFDVSEAIPRFSGDVLYRTTLEIDPAYTVLDLGDVGEIAEAWLNGQYLGARINAPYKFSLRNAMRAGENELCVQVKSNLGHRRRDLFSKYIPLPPTGIMGDIALCKYEELS